MQKREEKHGFVFA